MTVFTKLLVANRGEIAVRIMRTAKALGYRTVAVYSEADSHAPHVTMADQAVCIGQAAVGESYLRTDNILEAARRTNADAIHPGYGFLSENADFARACIEAGLVFIGPRPDAIELMGCKRQSKIAMQAAAVPCIPGYEGDEQDNDSLQKAALAIGFPLMIKASAGGGGRGMRLVHDDSTLLESLERARSEAENAFGNGQLILEKAILQPRHVEIQVFADQQGNTVYLGERDCSIQRRHQKVVEEAPSPAVDSTLRQRMGEAAVQAARTCNYVGAGTVEFLLDQNGYFYFLEMNTRLQVEHPVTELITDTDLVAWQLDIAAGKPLPLQQDEIALNGHAIEVRLYAEDPANQFMPQAGVIHSWQPVGAPGIRTDAGIATGGSVTPHYDPMLAKIIAWGKDREEARRRLVCAVEDTVLAGIKSNRSWLAAILSHPAFISGEATTAFLEQYGDAVAERSQSPSTQLLAIAAVLMHPHHSGENSLSGWRSTEASSRCCTLVCDDNETRITLTQHDGEYRVEVNSQHFTIALLDSNDHTISLQIDGITETVTCSKQTDTLYLSTATGDYTIHDRTLMPASSSDQAGDGRIQASMDGLIVDVLVEAGQNVHRGQTVMVLEAMKMEHPLKADCDGILSTLEVTSGEQVRSRQLLATIEPDTAA
ncbi:acetyl-CoA carboxylase biotin carboxylase subunit [Kistimonas asteriae]|uniref:acetyl-CoA carboxylase biotin carboxylase subunit n=1 Tax=Kistimonas asteriae TaxID=517724 RepID=UPI001BA5A3CD|nr:acetyl/propionyl/methylcrotonyl-CoA carboxylase subunit alpha [Kistimonas asteriae]